MKEKQTALFIGNRWVQNCEKRSRGMEGTNSRTLIGFSTFYIGSSKTRFQYCKNSRDVFLYIRAIQGHTGGNVTALELMGHVAIPYKWKEFLFHRGCSYDVTSILKSGLNTGGRESKEGRQTIFFTPLNSFGDNPDEEEPSDDLSKPKNPMP